ncbi:MAG: hypothetical protein WA744_08215, partial [Candidatus Acidiferrales bacterium]
AQDMGSAVPAAEVRDVKARARVVAAAAEQAMAAAPAASILQTHQARAARAAANPGLAQGSGVAVATGPGTTRLSRQRSCEI